MESIPLIRCPACGKLLCRAQAAVIEIKCPRCGHLHTRRATSPQSATVESVHKKRLENGSSSPSSSSHTGLAASPRQR
ncbi:Com family DNA-binding transcriptional regulator [Insolitispirillum peregrinum]|uniref:Com family DNA-binding transcriptional regulator n=1 Tax=Insolitispirillum peregrinum TaxID=80876 RepID=UPI0036097F06